MQLTALQYVFHASLIVKVSIHPNVFSNAGIIVSVQCNVNLGDAAMVHMA